MKKLLSLILISTFLIASFSSIAFAESSNGWKDTNGTKTTLWYQYSYASGSNLYYKITKLQTYYYGNYSSDNKITLSLQKYSLLIWWNQGSVTAYDKTRNVYTTYYANKTYGSGTRLRAKAAWNFYNPNISVTGYSYEFKVPSV